MNNPQRLALLAAVLSALCLAQLSEAKFDADNFLLRANSTGSLSLYESFGKDWTGRWTYSTLEKYSTHFYDTTPENDEQAITIAEGNKHYGMSSILPKGPLSLENGFVLQYEVQFSQAISCGGSYLKLLTHEDDMASVQAVLDGNTPYSVMFGPDKCGGPSKIHLIFRHRDKRTGEVVEKHLRDAVVGPDDAIAHVYTLIVRPDLTYEILVDGSAVRKGNLLTDLNPALVPPAVIPDPSDRKPLDWVDEAKILDPAAVKPDDWDVPELISDPNAKMPDGWLADVPAYIEDPEVPQPEEWDEEEDGKWAAPLIPNPRCKKAPGCGPWGPPNIRNPGFKGPWKAPAIDNPSYRGPWVQRRIPNPDFYEDKNPLSGVGKVGAVAFEIWTVDVGYIFDNILLGVGEDAEDAAEDARDLAWLPKHNEQKQMDENLQKKRRLEATRAERKASPKKHLADHLITYLDQERLQDYLWLTRGIISLLETSPTAAYPVVLIPVVLFISWAVWVVARPQVKPPKKSRAPQQLEEETKEEEAKEEEAKEEEKEADKIQEAEEEEVPLKVKEEEEEESEEDTKKKIRRRRRAD